MQKCNEKTSTKQYEKPDVARNYTKRSPEEVAAFWEEIAASLNDLGPRRRDTGGWKKVWSDYKTYIKKKLTTNAKEIAGTGGGPYKQKSFTAIEETVIELLSMTSSIQGIGASSFGENVRPPSSTPTKAQCGMQFNTTPTLSTANADTCNDDAPDHRTNPPSGAIKKPLSSIQLLSKQVDSQKAYFEEMTATLKSTNNYLKRVSRSLDNLCDLEKKKIKEIKEHNNDMKSCKKLSSPQ